ncbi:hypothetical protein B0H12DRAFT_1089724 [Mycena haematopus]|nr:hypothetical protein B0H12DRAFT_1089724 [Mycena haematopus]
MSTMSGCRIQSHNAARLSRRRRRSRQSTLADHLRERYLSSSQLLQPGGHRCRRGAPSLIFHIFPVLQSKTDILSDSITHNYS